jgi:hypothetical protein
VLHYDSNLEVDAIADGKPMEIFQVTRHWIVTMIPSDNTGSSILSLLQCVKVTDRKTSKK